jgi:hypothetical protein
MSCCYRAFLLFYSSFDFVLAAVSQTKLPLTMEMICIFVKWTNITNILYSMQFDLCLEGLCDVLLVCII